MSRAYLPSAVYSLSTAYSLSRTKSGHWRKEIR